jgi:dynein heavy chain, axonemal
MNIGRTSAILSTINLFASLCDRFDILLNTTSVKLSIYLERLLIFSIVWSIGGLLEPEDRNQFDTYIRTLTNEVPNNVNESLTLFDYYLESTNNELEWKQFKAPLWKYPTQQEPLDFSNLLVPTMDSARAMYLIQNLHTRKKPVLLVGGPGTAKTSTALMFFSTLDPTKHAIKRINFSSATLPGMFQESIESDLEKVCN